MVDWNKMRDNVRAKAAQQVGGTPKQSPTYTKDMTPEDRRKLSRENINNRIKQRFAQGDIPKPDESLGIGSRGQIAPDLQTSARAGLHQSSATWDYAQALVQDAFGDQEGANANIRSAQTDEMIANGLMAGGTDFEDVKNDPSFSNINQFATQTLGQLAPMAAESVMAGMAGEMLGGPIGAAIGGLRGGAAVRSLAKRSLRQSMARVAAGSASQADRQAFTSAIKATAARRLAQRSSGRWALAGATADEYGQGAGEAYSETLQAGNPSPWAAAGAAVPYAALGALSDKLVVDSLKHALHGADGPTKLAMKNLLSDTAKNAAAEGATEGLQEETLIQLRDALDGKNDYASSDEAWQRRMGAVAAGAIGGGARGGFTSVAQTAIRNMKAGKTLQTGHDSQMDAAVEDALKTDAPQPGNVRNMTIDEDTVMPEPQGDIDAQFRALMDEGNPKRAMEVTQGSPMPRDYRPGQNGVREVQTQNGVMLTRDNALADVIERSGGTKQEIADALGYGQAKRGDMSRAAVARDNQGNVVHSELISNDETDQAALQRIGQYAPNAAIEDANASLLDRAERVRKEGRDPAYESALVRLNKTKGRLERNKRSMEVLDAARNMGQYTERWGEIANKLKERRQRHSRLQAQYRQQAKAVADLEARQANQQDMMRERSEISTMLGTALKQAAENDPNSGGVEVVNNQTGEQRTIPQGVFDQLAKDFYDRDPSLTPTEVTQRISDELSDRGYSLNENDAKPIPIEDIDRDRIEAMKTRESEMGYDNPDAYRVTKPGERQGFNRTRPEQVVGKSYRLGPQTEAATVGGQRVPKSAVKELRRLRNKYPEDDWSLARWTNKQGQRYYHVKRTQSFSRREADDPVNRAQEGTGPDGLAFV